MKYLLITMLSILFISNLYAKDNLSLASSLDSIDNNHLIAKMNPYVGVINSYSTRVSSSLQRYLSWVDKDNGPTGKEKVIYGLYTISDPETAIENSEASAALSPAIPMLDKVGKEYADAIVELNELLNDANDYYYQEDYHDDDMAKGKALHPKLMASFARTTTADRNLRSVTKKIENVLTRRELAMLAEDETKKPYYLLKRFMVEAETVMNLGGSAIDKIDKEALKIAVTTLNKTVSEWKDYTKTDAGKLFVEENDSINDFLSDTVKAFQKTAKGLNRRVKNNTPYTSGEKMNLGTGIGAWMVEGSPHRLLYDYNSMIRSFNNLSY